MVQTIPVSEATVDTTAVPHTVIRLVRGSVGNPEQEQGLPSVSPCEVVDKSLLSSWKSSTLKEKLKAMGIAIPAATCEKYELIKLLIGHTPAYIHIIIYMYLLYSYIDSNKAKCIYIIIFLYISIHVV
jgi:hypothetical protein